MVVKRPASQYYWGDWWKDKGLHSCSLAARGLWHEMNCLMHEGEPYGHLTLAGRPMSVAQLANQCRISAQQCERLLRELEDAGVPSRSADGLLFSRRMVRDEAARNARAEGGQAGAEHGMKGAEHGAKGGRPRTDKGASKTPLPPAGEPPPSSSSSTASSTSEEENPSGPSAKPTSRSRQAVSKSTPTVPCPYEKIIEQYHDKLPELPRVVIVSESRQRAMRKTWAWALSSTMSNGKRRAETADQAVAWFGVYFERASHNDFLMGRTTRSQEHAGWTCDFDFLLTERGMKHVIEKTEVQAA